MAVGWTHLPLIILQNRRGSCVILDDSKLVWRLRARVCLAGLSGHPPLPPQQCPRKPFSSRGEGGAKAV